MPEDALIKIISDGFVTKAKAVDAARGLTGAPYQWGGGTEPQPEPNPPKENPK